MCGVCGVCGVCGMCGVCVFVVCVVCVCGGVGIPGGWSDRIGDGETGRRGDMGWAIGPKYAFLGWHCQHSASTTGLRSLNLAPWKPGNGHSACHHCGCGTRPKITMMVPG